MILKMDQLPIELPTSNNPSANDAAALQELIGGKFGEMSTLMNYTYQSFNFRGRKKLRPFYDLICSIAGEEYGHIEVASYATNLLLTGTTKRGIDPTVGPMAEAANWRNTLSPVGRRLCRWIRWAISRPGKTYLVAVI